MAANGREYADTFIDRYEDVGDIVLDLREEYGDDLPAAGSVEENEFIDALVQRMRTHVQGAFDMARAYDDYNS